MTLSTAGLHADNDERLVRMKAIVSAYGLQPDDTTVAEVVSLIKMVRSVMCSPVTSCMTAGNPTSGSGRDQCSKDTTDRWHHESVSVVKLPRNLGRVPGGQRRSMEEHP